MQKLFLGKFEAKRDCIKAKDYVEMQWLMLQQETDDFVISTGKQYSVRDFVNLSYECLGKKSGGRKGTMKRL